MFDNHILEQLLFRNIFIDLLGKKYTVVLE